MFFWATNGLVHTNPSSKEIAPFSMSFDSTLIVFVSFSPVHTTTPYPFWKRFIPSVCMLKWTRRMRISISPPAKLAPFLILCCWVLLWFRILWYFPSKRCQIQLESNQTLKPGGGLRESRSILVFSRSWQGQKPSNISCFLLVKSKWRRLSLVKCACKPISVDGASVTNLK